MDAPKLVRVIAKFRVPSGPAASCTIAVEGNECGETVAAALAVGLASLNLTYSLEKVYETSTREGR